MKFFARAATIATIRAAAIYLVSAHVEVSRLRQQEAAELEIGRQFEARLERRFTENPALLALR